MPAVLAAMMWGKEMQTFRSIYSANLVLASSFFLNLLIKFYLNNVTNLHQLTSHGMALCPQHGDRIESS